MKYKVVILQDGKLLTQPWTIESGEPIQLNEIYGAGTIANMADKKSPLGAPFTCGQYKVVSVFSYEGENVVSIEYMKEPAIVRDVATSVLYTFWNKWKYTIILCSLMCAYFYGGFQLGSDRGYQKGFQEASNWAGTIYFTGQHYGRFLLKTDTFPYRNGNYYQFHSQESRDSVYARKKYEEMKLLLEHILPDSVKMKTEFY